MQSHEEQEQQDVPSSKLRLRKYSYKEAQQNPTSSKTDNMSGTIIEDIQEEQEKEQISNNENRQRSQGEGLQTSENAAHAKINKDEFQKKSTGQKLDSVADAINRMCEKMSQMETQLQAKIKPMKEAIFSKEDSITSILAQMATNVETSEKQVKVLVSENVDLRDEVEILKGTVQKQSNQIASLQRKLTDQIARSMENNLIISGMLGDGPKADVCSQVLKFLSEVLEINFNPYDVLEVNRMGAPARGKHRPTLVQCTVGLRKFILWNIDNLAQKTNANGERYYINQQVPDEIAEQK